MCQLTVGPGARSPSTTPGTRPATDEEMAPRPFIESPHPRRVLSSVTASSGRPVQGAIRPRPHSEPRQDGAWGRAAWLWPAHFPSTRPCRDGGGTQGEVQAGEESRDGPCRPGCISGQWRALPKDTRASRQEALGFSQSTPKDPRVNGHHHPGSVKQKRGIRANNLLKTTSQGQDRAG